MTKAKRIVKKKLKEPDEFITFTEKTYIFITRHFRKIAAGGVILLVIILSFYLYQRWDRKNEGQAYRAFTFALETYERVDSPYREGSAQEFKNILGKLDEVITKFPRTTYGKLSFLYKGNIYFRLGEFEEAVKAYERFLQKGGKEKIYQAFAMQSLGYAYEKREDYEKAVNAFQKVIEIGESFQVGNAYLGMGRCYEKMGKTKESLENYKQFLKVSEKSQMANIILKKVSSVEK